MITVTLAKWKKKPTKTVIAQNDRIFAQAKKDGVKILGFYWTLGRFDSVLITEAPNEKTVFKYLMKFADVVSTETMVAMKREQAVKLLE